MNPQQDQHNPLDHLGEIRSIMERSTKVISLSGLSGVAAGVVALGGAWMGYQFLQENGLYENFQSREWHIATRSQFRYLILLAVGIIALAAGAASFFSMRLAKKRDLPIWNKTAKRMFLSLAVPLGAGAIFCFLLALYGVPFLVAPATLIFYGLALIQAGKYTFGEIRYLGFTEVILGLVASIFPGYGLMVWALGFGFFHIFYGVIMYFKYERK